MPPRTRRQGGRTLEADQGEIIMFFLNLNDNLKRNLSHSPCFLLYLCSIGQGEIQDHGGVLGHGHGHGPGQGRGGQVDPGDVKMYSILSFYCCK